MRSARVPLGQPSARLGLDTKPPPQGSRSGIVDGSNLAHCGGALPEHTRCLDTMDLAPLTVSSSIYSSLLFILSLSIPSLTRVLER